MSDLSPIHPDFAIGPVPEPRVQVKRLMLATSLLVDGFLDQHPERFHPYLANCFVVPEAGVVIAGTACRRPLLLREIRDVCSAVNREGIVVRLGDGDALTSVSYDVERPGERNTLCAYRLWMPQPVGPAWLVPTAGEATYVRFDPRGLEFSDDPPFADGIDRHRGIKFGSEFLSVAVKGWF